jgi:GH24 family phage-related lysozyme (muramidase)
LDAEGLDQPSEWPGGDSGITLGVGYDLGYEDSFEKDWNPYLTTAQIDRLKTVVGVKGEKAKSKASNFSDILIKRSDAENVFREVMLPRYIQYTEEAFPGLDNLPLDAKGALVSLVFNRGASMDGDRRSEMRVIKETIPEYTNDPEGVLREIANQLQLMKRLWVGKGVDGLLRRRDAEADLVLSCISELSESVETSKPKDVSTITDKTMSVVNAIVDVIKKLLGGEK